MRFMFSVFFTYYTGAIGVEAELLHGESSSDWAATVANVRKMNRLASHSWAEGWPQTENIPKSVDALWYPCNHAITIEDKEQQRNEQVQ